jgi:protein-tyrosine phosphatase
MSVTGEFGIAAKTCADILLRHNCVHFLASDAHRSKTRRPVLSKARAAAAILIGEQRARALVCENPSAVIRGEAFHVEPPLPFASAGSNRSFFSRLFSR